MRHEWQIRLAWRSPFSARERRHADGLDEDEEEEVDMGLPSANRGDTEWESADSRSLLLPRRTNPGSEMVVFTKKKTSTDTE